MAHQLDIASGENELIAGLETSEFKFSATMKVSLGHDNRKYSGSPTRLGTPTVQQHYIHGGYFYTKVRCVTVGGF
jgi:hypothetical protein